MNRLRLTGAAALLAALVLAGCSLKPPADGPNRPTQAVKAVAVLVGTTGHEKVSGLVTFSQSDGQVQIVADVQGLTPDQRHAIHVHEFGDCTALDAASAGGHYNPQGRPHGLPPDAQRHAGDLGNLQADKDGKARLVLVVDNITIAGPKNPVLGRAVIVHERPDDGSQPTGNAGGRIACGVIGLAKP